MKTQLLLTRDQFRAAVLQRDGHRCVICGSDGKLDAHHIMERRLFSDGGYYLDNGASLCDDSGEGCHMKAETTELSVEDIRLAARIFTKILPEDLYADHTYDKWGNTILTNGLRTKGPLFFDESVQKVLANYVHLFTDYVKYPRTYHLPWSPGVTDDDRVAADLSHFEGKRVIVTEKLDGENFSGYTNYCHARSVDGRHHYTRDWAKSFWMARSYELPEGWRFCGENLWAVHSISYDQLPSYLMGFSIWDDRNTCLSWDDTLTWFELLDVPHVPVIYDGIWDEAKIRAISLDFSKQEGYVVRVADAFSYGDFRRSVAKFVRANHVQSQKHWFYGQNNHQANVLAVDKSS